MYKKISKVSSFQSRYSNKVPDFENVVCPLIYPLYSEDVGLKEYLISKGVFVATYWPYVIKTCTPDMIEYDLASHLIALPIDQRYGLDEMKYILSVIDQFNKIRIMKKLLILGSSKACKEMIAYAKSQGIYTIVTDYFPPEKSSAKLLADEYWMISTGDYDQLEIKCREEQVNGVCSGISTFNIPATAELCKRLGLQAYCTPESWHYTINKYDFKALCRSCQVPVATDYFVSNPPTDEELNSIKFPVVVKCVDQSANRGMSYCSRKDDIAPAIEYALSFSKSDKYVIERMLKGIEYTAYYALADGEASLVCLFSDIAQKGTPNKCYTVNSTACDKLDLYLKEVDPYFRKALKQGGISEGVCWIEMILDEDGHFYVIEMGYRMSGDMMAIPIQEVTGFNSYKWLIDYSLGAKRTAKDLPPSQTEPFKRCGCSYILWSKAKKGVVSKIEGIDEICSNSNVYLEPTVKVGSKFKENQYLLTFLFTENNADEVCKVIENINKVVKVIDEEGEDVVMRFTDYDELRRIYYCK